MTLTLNASDAKKAIRATDRELHFRLQSAAKPQQLGRNHHSEASRRLIMHRRACTTYYDARDDEKHGVGMRALKRLRSESDGRDTTMLKNCG